MYLSRRRNPKGKCLKMKNEGVEIRLKIKTEAIRATHALFFQPLFPAPSALYAFLQLKSIFKLWINFPSRKANNTPSTQRVCSSFFLLKRRLLKKRVVLWATDLKIKQRTEYAPEIAYLVCQEFTNYKFYNGIGLEFSSYFSR